MDSVFHRSVRTLRRLYPFLRDGGKEINVTILNALLLFVSGSCHAAVTQT